MLHFHPLRVAGITPEARNAVCVSFEVPAALRDVFRFVPGQHIVVKATIDGQEVRRTYSICGAPDYATIRIGVKVVLGGAMSTYLARHVRAGDTLDVLPPAGSFTTAVGPAPLQRCVCFAAGSGITPILSIVGGVLEGSGTARCILIYGNRTSADVMFVEDLWALKNRFLDRLALHFVFSGEPQDVEMYNGRIDADRIRRLASVFDPPGTDAFFLCGPGTMCEDATAALEGLGVPRARIHVERFVADGAVAAVSPVVVSESAKAAGFAATVTVIMDGRTRTFSMAPEQTILSAARAAGLDLPFSCTGGVCATCRSRLVKGTVRMDVNYSLEPKEVADGFILACQAHPTATELVLDYDRR